MHPLDFHVNLKTYAVQEYFDPVSGACLSLKNSREPFEWTCLNQHLGARLETCANFYKTHFIYLRSDDIDHTVINWRRGVTHTHNAMYSSGETNLMKHTVQCEPCEEISRKQRFNEIRRFICEFIETAVPYPGEEYFHVPSL